MKFHLPFLVAFVTSVFISTPGLCDEEKSVWQEDGTGVIQDEVYVPETNEAVLISRGKETSQSSFGFDGYASYGNDGNTNQNYAAKTCTHTKLDRNPWWKIDFGSRHFIDRVIVFNRADCCGARLNTLKVQVSDNNVDWTEVGALNEAATEGKVYTIPAKGQGRYLRLIIGKSEPEYLTLCEVEVYGNQLSAPLISRGKFASQSSIGYDGPPHLAIDGSYSQNYGQKTCTHTSLEVNPWWKIDLGRYYHLHSVKIWNRADCCSERLNSLIVQGSKDDVNWYHIGSLNEAPNAGVLTIPLRSHWKYRYVRLTLSKDTADYLTLCEVEIYGTRRRLQNQHLIDWRQSNSVLISRGKDASQSSFGYDGHPSRGTDANYNQVYSGNSCTHTQGERNPWWRLDLGSSHYIAKVKVWNRADCCGNRLSTLKVQSSDDNLEWTDIGALSEQATDGGVYTINTNGNGRYVRLIIAKSEPEYLTLCEVEVYGNQLSAGLISRGKYASQSSIGYDGFPHLGNDGLYWQGYGQKTCTHTNLEKNPWWKIDLGSIYNIESVRVWNRADCCGERLNSLVVHVSSDNSNWNHVGSLGQQATNGGIYTIPAKGTGRYVRLMLGKDSQDYLTLCEVDVYGEPNRG